MPPRMPRGGDLHADGLMKRRNGVAVILTLIAVMMSLQVPAAAQEGYSLLIEEQGPDLVLAGYTGELPLVLEIPCGVTVIGEEAFIGEQAVESVSIPEGVREIREAAFMDCTGLTDVVLPSSLREIRDGAFCGCTKLKSVQIPAGVSVIGMGAFGACSSLKEIAVPGGVRILGGSAFAYCSRLASVTLGEGIAYLGPCAFADCTALKEIVLPQSLRSIQDGCFKCSGLTSLSIPEGPTYLSYTFDECKSLETLFIPASIVEIEGSVFRRCSALKKVTYAGSEEAWQQALKYGNSSLPSGAELICLGDSAGPAAPDEPTPAEDLPSLRADSVFAIAETAVGLTFSGVEIGRGDDFTSTADVVAAFDSPLGTSVDVTHADGMPCDGDEPVATGDIVHLRGTEGGAQLITVVIPGDVAGSGILNIAQVTRLASALNGALPLTGPYLQAGLLTGGSRISVSDLVTLAKWLTE